MKKNEDQFNQPTKLSWSKLVLKKNSHPLYYHRCCFCEEEASATAAEYIFDHPSGDSRSLSGRSLWAATD